MTLIECTRRMRYLCSGAKEYVGDRHVFPWCVSPSEGAFYAIYCLDCITTVLPGNCCVFAAVSDVLAHYINLSSAHPMAPEEC